MRGSRTLTYYELTSSDKVTVPRLTSHNPQHTSVTTGHRFVGRASRSTPTVRPKRQHYYDRQYRNRTGDPCVPYLSFDGAVPQS